MDSPSSSGPIALGVDFGTSHTVAVLGLPHGRTRPLLFDGSPLLPSAVFADDDGRLITGRDAVRAGLLRPEGLEPNPKRRIDDETVLLGRREFPVVDLFAAVLARVREEAVRVAGRVDRVALTVPATWGPTRRHQVTDAASAAGLRVSSLAAEPVAAAAYFTSALKHAVPIGSAVVIHDFGAGTFDVSVVARTNRGFEVLAVDGRDDLGGLDLDAALVDYIGAQVSGKDDWQRLVEPATSADRRHRRTLFGEVRAAKEQLSREQRADLLVPLLDTSAHLTRGELEQVVAPLLARAVKVTGAAIREAGLSRERTAGVFLVGGASRMPLVATMLHRELGTAPTVLEQPELVVAEGALLAAEASLLRPSEDETPTRRLPQARPTFQTPPTEPIPVGPEPRRGRGLLTSVMAAVIAVVLGVVAAYVMWPDKVSPGGGAVVDEWDSQFVSAGADGSIRTWELDGTSSGVPLRGHEGTVFAAAFAQVGDDRVLVSSGHDDTIRVWTLGDDSDPLVIEAHDDSIGAVAVAELTDGSAIVSAGNDGLAKVWDLESGDQIAVFEGHTDDVRAIATAELDGRVVAVSGGNDGTLRVWDPSTGREVVEPATTGAKIRALATGILFDEPVVFAGCNDKQIQVWNLADMKQIGSPLEGHTGTVRVAEPYDAAEGPALISTGDDGTVRVWDLESGTEVRRFDEHTGPVYALALDLRAGEARIISGDSTGRIVSRAIDTGKVSADFDSGHTFVQAIALPAQS